MKQMEALTNLIAGKPRAPLSQRYLDIIAPATGAVCGQVPDSGPEDVALAVAAAKGAQSSWARTPVRTRSDYLRTLASLIRRDLELLAHLETLDTGKPLHLSRTVDIPRAAQNFDFFADAITQFSTEAHLTDQSAINWTVRQPVGVAACISPWNLPLYLLSWKVAPALASGCTVVAKPSELTPLSASHLAKLTVEAGLPPGVFNLIHGTGAQAGATLVAHPDVHAVSFTGSTQTGAAISRIVAPRFAKLSLEMGGKNPTIVYDDCNFEAALEGVVRSAFTNQGQICLCGSRIYIHSSIYARFRDALVKRVQALTVGDPLDPKTDQGAVVSAPHLTKVLGAIESARAAGGKLLCGGQRSPQPGALKNGFYLEPTLIEGLDSHCSVQQEEVFGPLATLTPFESESQLLEMANGVRYGLAASIWTQDIDRAHRTALALEAGIVWINCWMLRDLRTPFGGMKDSGVGREGGQEALRFFTEPKNVCIKLTP